MQIKKGEIYGLHRQKRCRQNNAHAPCPGGAAMPTGGSIELFGGEESENEARHRIGALL